MPRLPILIPWGVRTTVSVEGCVRREIECESCGETYFYTLGRRTKATERSFILGDHEAAEEEAAQQATEQLRHALASGMDFVACPSCGRYPAAVASRLRKSRAVVALAPGLIFSVVVISMPFEHSGAAAAVALLLSLIAAVVFMARDPNDASRLSSNRMSTRARTREQLRELRSREEADPEALAERRRADPEDYWKCPRCSAENPNATFQCRECRYSLV